MAEIIGEIGINFQGSMTYAFKMINILVDNGIEVAKFQVYDPIKMLSPSAFSSEDWNMILKSELTFEQTKSLKQYCDKKGIEFMASAFDFERLEWLEKLNVKRHKIASRTVFDKEYCEAVISTNKEVLISDGHLRSGNLKDETVEEIFERLKIYNGDGKSKLLYCSAQYPTRLKELNFYSEMFKEKDFVGFSDHTIGLTAAKTAIVMGANIIEKHFTLDKTFYGPDHICSMTPDEVKDLANFNREFSQIRIN